MKLLIAAVMTAFMLALVSPVLAKETITIGAEDDWYPYGGQINGESRGFGVDLVGASLWAATMLAANSVTASSIGNP